MTASPYREVVTTRGTAVHLLVADTARAPCGRDVRHPQDPGDLDPRMSRWFTRCHTCGKYAPDHQWRWLAP